MKREKFKLVHFLRNIKFREILILLLLLAVFTWNSTTQFLGILIGPASIMLAISGFAI